jgi:import inner membrane translocase subunit TIM21
MSVIHNTLLRTAELRLCQQCKPQPLQFLRARRSYASTKSTSKPTISHKQVTTFNDDGRVRWSELSVREKAARSTQQSFNFLVIIAGVVMTGAVATLMYKEVFSTDSKTSHFNRTVSRIKKDARCVDVLAGGDPRKIKAYGEPSWNRWSRNRALASRVEKDGVGVEHLHMHFNVEGPMARGVAQLHMVKRPGQSEWDYLLLAVDVPGHQRIYLENADGVLQSGKGSGKMFGLKWW